MRTLMLIAALALAAPAVAPVEECAASQVLARLAGAWKGSGETNGMPAALELRWEPALGGAFTRLTLENRMTAADGKEWHFQAQAYYRAGRDGAISGNWFDSRGMSLPLAGSAVPGEMTILWGSEATERGRSSYRLTADALEITDEVLTRDGDWRVFGRSRLTRME